MVVLVLVIKFSERKGLKMYEFLYREYETLLGSYERLPFTEKPNLDLSDHVTGRTRMSKPPSDRKRPAPHQRTARPKQPGSKAWNPVR